MRKLETQTSQTMRNNLKHLSPQKPRVRLQLTEDKASKSEGPVPDQRHKSCLTVALVSHWGMWPSWLGTLVTLMNRPAPRITIVTTATPHPRDPIVASSSKPNDGQKRKPVKAPRSLDPRLNLSHPRITMAHLMHETIIGSLWRAKPTYVMGKYARPSD